MRRFSLLTLLLLMSSFLWVGCNDPFEDSSSPGSESETTLPDEDTPTERVATTTVAGDPNEVNPAEAPSEPNLSTGGGWLSYRPDGTVPVRWHFFRDDSKIEASDRTRPLPAQTLFLNGRRVNDPRLHLLRHKVGTRMQRVYRQKVTEEIEKEVIQKMGGLVNMDLKSELSPVLMMQRTLEEAARYLKAKAPDLEREFAAGGTRTLTFLIAPWQRVPGSENTRTYKRAQRFTPHQLGFDCRQRTPVRDWAAKHTQMDGDDDRAIRLFRGDFGNLGNQFHHLVDKVIDRGLEDPYSQASYQVNPPAYPLAFLLQLKFEQGRSRVALQALMALQPNNMPLDPPEDAPFSKITYAGVPAKVRPNGSVDVATQYPLMLVTFDHPIRDEVTSTPIHVEFGTWNGFEPTTRRLSVDHSGQNWKMTPFLGGGICVGSCSTYFFNLTQGMRIHMTKFDIEIDSEIDSAQAVRLERLETAVEIFDPSNSVLRTSLNIPIRSGEIIDRIAPQVLRAANEQIGTAANEKIKQAFETAVTSMKQDAEKKFPLALLFLRQTQGQASAGEAE